MPLRSAPPREVTLITSDALLVWLSKEDQTPLGSCEGPALKELRRLGRVKYREGNPMNAVELTEAGIEHLKTLKR